MTIPYCSRPATASERSRGRIADGNAKAVERRDRYQVEDGQHAVEDDRGAEEEAQIVGGVPEGYASGYKERRMPGHHSGVDGQAGKTGDHQVRQRAGGGH